MSGVDLLALAATCEAAEKPTVDLFREIYFAVHGPKPAREHGGSSELTQYLHRYNPYYSLISHGGWIDAALLLVPEDMRDEIEITTLYRVARVTINMNHTPDDGPFYGSNVCNSIPLAICSAALRARHQSAAGEDK